MAGFAPYLEPTSPGSYLRLSNTITQPGPDSSTGMIWSTLGNAVEGAAKLADSYIKRDSDEQIHAQMDKLQEEKNQSIATTYNAVTKGTVADAEGNPVSLTDLFTKKPEERTPADIKNIEQIARNLRAGREHGQYSDTYYRMQVDKFAKEMRSKYPGYRDYIDAKIKGEEGSTANELATSMIADLNAAMAGTKKETDKVETQLLSHLNLSPEIYAAWANWKAGKMTDGEALQVLAKHRVIQQDLENRKITNQLGKEDHQKTADDESAFATQHLRQLFVEGFNVALMSDGEMNTAKKAQDKMLEMAAKGVKLSDQELQQVGQIFQASENMIRSRSEAYMDEIWNPTDPKEKQLTRRALIGAKKAGELIEENMKQVTDLKKFFYDGNFGMAAAGKMANEARINDMQGYFMQNYPDFAKIAAVNKMAGPDAAKSVMLGMLGNGGITQEAKVWAMDKGFNMILNKPDLRVPPTITAAANEANIKGLPGDTIQYLVDTAAERITDPKTTPEAKHNIIQNVFGPGNEKLFDVIPDATKTRDGRRVKGKETIFQDLTTKEVTDNVYKHGISDWTTYKKGVQGWAATYLIPGNVKTITELQQGDLKSDFIDIQYNPDTHQFVVRPKSLDELQKSISGDKQKMQNLRNVNMSDISNAAYIAQASVDKINNVLRSYTHIAETEKSDVNGFIANRLVEMGYAPKEGKSPLVDAMRKSFGKKDEESVKKGL